MNVEDLVEAIPPREMREVEKWRRERARAHFYADESFPDFGVRILRRFKCDIRTANEARLLGRDDRAQRAYARRAGRFLLTCDRDFLDERRFPLIRCPGLAVFSFGSRSRSEIIDALAALSVVIHLPRMYDKWAKLDASPAGWTEFNRFLDGRTARTRLRWHRGKIQEWVTPGR